MSRNWFNENAVSFSSMSKIKNHTAKSQAMRLDFTHADVYFFVFPRL